MKLNELLNQADEKKKQCNTEGENNFDIDLNSLRVQKIRDFYLKKDKDLTEKSFEKSILLLQKLAKQSLEEISEYEFIQMYQTCSEEELFEDVEQMPLQNIYRTKVVYIFDTQVKASDAQEINHFMEHFISQMQYSMKWMHPVEFAAMSHKRILDIQPFLKHNEFLSFLFLNRILISCGYPLTAMLGEDYELYKNAYFATRGMNNPDIDSFTAVIAGCIGK